MVFAGETVVDSIVETTHRWCESAIHAHSRTLKRQTLTHTDGVESDGIVGTRLVTPESVAHGNNMLVVVLSRTGQGRWGFKQSAKPPCCPQSILRYLNFFFCPETRLLVKSRC